MTKSMHSWQRIHFFCLSLIDVGYELSKREEKNFGLGKGSLKLDRHAEFIAILDLH